MGLFHVTTRGLSRTLEIPSSIWQRLFDVINDKNCDWARLRLQLETELLAKSFEKRWAVLIGLGVRAGGLRNIGLVLHVKVKTAYETRAVNHRPIR